MRPISILITLGLSIEYKNKGSNMIGKFLTYVFGLLFLKPKTVDECIAIDLAFVQNRTVKIHTFCDYLLHLH